MNLFVVLLNIRRESLEKVGVHVEGGGASVPRAHHFFKVFDFVDDIMVQARLAEVEFMLTIAHVHL